MLFLETKAAAAVRGAAHAEEEAVCAALTLAFSTDPAVRWAYPDPRQYVTCFPHFARAFGGRAFAHGTAHVVEGLAGAALWLPPGVEPGEELDGTIRETVSARLREEVYAVFDQMLSYHPEEPHWYLPLIGVDAAFQGRGYGSALLRHALAVCDRDGTPAYLESSNPRNVTLYQRHGFEVLGTVQAEIGRASCRERV